MKNAMIGAFGETQAVKYLRLKHYEIFCCNYRCRLGEIDIIAAKGGYLVFCEVKTRSQAVFAQPMEYVDEHKQRRLRLTAELYLQQNPSGLQPRFDVLEVFVEYPGGILNLIKINHYIDAF